MQRSHQTPLLRWVIQGCVWRALFFFRRIQRSLPRFFEGEFFLNVKVVASESLEIHINLSYWLSSALHHTPCLRLLSWGDGRGRLASFLLWPLPGRYRPRVLFGHRTASLFYCLAREAHSPRQHFGSHRAWMRFVLLEDNMVRFECICIEVLRGFWSEYWDLSLVLDREGVLKGDRLWENLVQFLELFKLVLGRGLLYKFFVQRQHLPIVPIRWLGLIRMV